MTEAAPNVWIVTPAWRRVAVTRLSLAQRARLSGELAARGINLNVVVVADDTNLDAATEWGFHALEAPNELGRKVNDGIEYALNQDADYVTVVGSDDWIHHTLFDRLPAPHAPQPDLDENTAFVTWDPNRSEAVTGRQISVVNLHTGRLTQCEGRGPAGVIPWVFPRRALEQVNGRPANDQVRKGLDGSMLATIAPFVEWVWHDPHPLARVDFKSAVNLNSYEHITHGIGVRGDEDAWQALAGMYDAQLVELAQHTADILVAA